MDTFFVSVERLLDPTLVGKPVLVGGTTSGRGVVSACSYETRPYGVRSGMPMRQAIRLCPQAIVLPGQYGRYGDFAQHVRALVHAAVPVAEFASIDECYCDLTGTDRFHSAWGLAQDLRATVKRETGLPLSMCLASTKSTAKMGTGQAKPDGELHLLSHQERAFLAALPVRKIPGLGPKAAQRLAMAGVVSIAQLQALPPAQLEDWFGAWGQVLWQKANGTRHSPVQPDDVRKQIGKEVTFGHDRAEWPFLIATLTALAERVGERLRRDGRHATTVTLKLRYGNFETLTHQHQVAPTQSDQVLTQSARRLLGEVYQAGRPVRLLGVSVSGLVWGGTQLELYADRAREGKLSSAKDALNRRYGGLLVRSAAGLVPPDATHPTER